MTSATSRSRWAAIGAAIAVTLGAGGIGITHATTDSGERPVYLPIEPCRLADLRPAPDTVGPRTAPLGPDETYTLSGWGNVGECALPAGTAGLALNVTALGATLPTFLAVFPADATDVPNASNLNPVPGQPPIPNAVNVDLDAAGEFSIYNLQGNVNVIVDVVGIYDDHIHDDRYYTEGEVDTALAGKVDAEPIWAGQLAVRIPANGGFAFGHDTYPGPLPVGTPVPDIEYIPEGGPVSADCPGIGQVAVPDLLCIYGYNNSNIDSAVKSGGFGGENYRFGFALDVFPSNAANPAFFLASWAYQAPTG